MSKWEDELLEVQQTAKLQDDDDWKAFSFNEKHPWNDFNSQTDKKMKERRGLLMTVCESSSHIKRVFGFIIIIHVLPQLFFFSFSFQWLLKKSLQKMRLGPLWHLAWKTISLCYHNIVLVCPLFFTVFSSQENDVRDTRRWDEMWWKEDAMPTKSSRAETLNWKGEKERGGWRWGWRR